MKKFLYLMVAVALLFSADAYSQMNRKSIKKNNRRISHFRGKKFHFGPEKKYNSLGISLNALNYYGDLAPAPNRVSTDIAFTRPGIGLSLTHRFGPRYSLTGNFMYGTVSGSDSRSSDASDASSGVYRYQRNLSFRNRIKEFSVVGNFDLFQNQSTYISRVKWTPFLYAGAAIFHHNPQALAPKTDVHGNPLPGGGEWVNLQPLGTEGQNADLDPNDVNYGNTPYKLIQIAIPFGLGVRFRINEVLDFSAEFGFRYLFTDYIDDVSKNFVDLGVFGDDEMAKALSYRTHELPEFAPAAANTSLTSYMGRDNQTYYVLSGYGSEYKNETSSNIRGNSSDRDIYTVTTFKLSYILGKTFHRAKFR
jgi:hypothetical protein